MNAVIILVGVVAVFGATFASPTGRVVQLNGVDIDTYVFEDLINSTINSVVALAAQFDPIDVAHEELNLLGHQGEITNVHVEGFSNVVATHIKLSGLITWTLELTVEASRAWGTAENWKVEGDLLYGDGSVNVDINNVKVVVKAKINPLTMNIKDLLITPSIGNAAVSITGLWNDEERSQKVSDYLNVLLNDVINNDTELHKKVSEAAREYIQNILDALL